jgi:hypothetical protein
VLGRRRSGCRGLREQDTRLARVLAQRAEELRDRTAQLLLGSAAAVDHGVGHRAEQLLGQAIEHSEEERLAVAERLIEVAVCEPGLAADVLDAGGGEATGTEQLESRVEQLGPSCSDPVAGADPAVAALGNPRGHAWMLFDYSRRQMQY